MKRYRLLSHKYGILSPGYKKLLGGKTSMKKIIAVLLVAAMALSFVACGRNQVPDFDDWGTYRLGHVTVRIPSDDVEVEREVEEGLEFVIAESYVAGANVLVTQVVGFVSFLQEHGLGDEMFVATFLEEMVEEITAEFIREEGGNVRGHGQGSLNGLAYFSAYGETDLNNAYFEVRGFAYGSDFYFIMLLWNSRSADIVEPFFQSIQFSN